MKSAVRVLGQRAGRRLLRSGRRRTRKTSLARPKRVAPCVTNAVSLRGNCVLHSLPSVASTEAASSPTENAPCSE